MADTAEEEARVAAFGALLRERVIDALPGWIERVVIQHCSARNTSIEVADIAVLVARVVGDLDVALRAFFDADIDAQRTTPLATVRAAMAPVTAFLRQRGADAPPRDGFATRTSPDDIYALGPAAWSDLGEEVHIAGLHWGAAKAFLHRRRHG